MARRVYIYNFLDLNGEYKQIESEGSLNNFQQQVKINEHNIGILNKKYTELEVKYLKLKQKE